jgi:hypothetical protein
LPELLHQYRATVERAAECIEQAAFCMRRDPAEMLDRGLLIPPDTED